MMMMMMSMMVTMITKMMSDNDDEDHSDSKSSSIVTNLPQCHHSTCKIKSIIQRFPHSTAAVLPELLAAQLAGPDDF